MSSKWICCQCGHLNDYGGNRYCGGQLPSHGKGYPVPCDHGHCPGCNTDSPSNDASYETNPDANAQFQAQYDNGWPYYHHSAHPPPPPPPPPPYHPQPPIGDPQPSYQYSSHQSSLQQPPSQTQRPPSLMDRYLGPPRYSNEADIITIGQYDSLHNPPPKYVAPVGYLSDIKFRKGLNSSVSSAVTGRMGELMERETQPLKWPWGRQHCTNHTTNNNNNNNNNHNNTHNNTPPPPQQQPEERVRNREKKGKGKEIDHRKSTSSSSSSSNNSNSKRKEREEGDRGKGKGRQERMPESPAYKRRKENGGYHRPTVEDWDDAEQEEEEEQDL